MTDNLSGTVSVPALRVEGLSKTFGGVRVLRDLTLTVPAASVVGLVGGNGAGKSTFVKILSGFHAPDPGGRVEVTGSEVALPLAPGEGRKYGLSFVQQDLALVPHASVLENLRVGMLTTTAWGSVRWPRERQAARDALDVLGIDLDLDVSVDYLTVTQRALVAVARAISQTSEHAGRGLLVLDEPTAYLPTDGVGILFDAVRRVVASGTSVLFVSHRLDEVMELTDSVAVLRDGGLVAELRTADVTEDDLVQAILGEDLGELYPEREAPGGGVVFSVSSLTGGSVHGLDLEVAAGEIVGLTGITGMGHDEVPYLIFGEADSGTLVVDGASRDLASSSPADAVAQGLALLPADRPRLSGVLDFSVRENISLPVLNEFFDKYLRLGRERTQVATLMEEFDVRPRGAGEHRLGQLSGGNQQKAMLAKWIQTDPKVLLLHEPTQGVDVGARRDVFAQLQELARRGVAIVVASAEHEDLAHLCHRVLVFRRGQVSTVLSGPALTERALVEASLRSAETVAALDPEGEAHE